jgi:hypothetical protein
VRWIAVALLACNHAALPASSDGAIPASSDGAAPDLAVLTCGSGRMCSGTELCQDATSCCSCGAFGHACIGPVWTCAVPSRNDPRCPSAPPVPLDPCALPDGIGCWYCTPAGPLLADCIANTFFSECKHDRCWDEAGPSVTCD